MDEEITKALAEDKVFEVHVPASAPWRLLKQYFHETIELYKRDPTANVFMLDLPGELTPDELASVYVHLKHLRANFRAMVAHRKAGGG